MSEETALIRDQLGNDPSTFPVLIPDYYEELGIEEGYTKVEKNNIGNSWIVGSPTNGIVGTNTGTPNGLQQVVGESGRSITVVKVVNPNNTHNERFEFTELKDTGSTTAVWTGSGSATINASTELQSLTIWKESGSCVTATMEVTISSGTTNISEFMSANGTATAFESVTDGVEHTFTNKNNDLRWKITSAGTAVITRVKISYTIVSSSPQVKYARGLFR